jgi:hypothetical protein
MTRSGNFFMVYGDGQRAPAFKHDSIVAATREAERLSRDNPGISFFVLMPISVSTRVDVETRELVNLSDIGIPF